MKQVKIEWCENFIRAAFGPKHHAYAGKAEAGIEVNCFWKMAQDAGLWEPGIYGGPMSEALEKLTVVESINTDDGKFLFNVFRLAQ